MFCGTRMGVLDGCGGGGGGGGAGACATAGMVPKYLLLSAMQYIQHRLSSMALTRCAALCCGCSPHTPQYTDLPQVLPRCSSIYQNLYKRFIDNCHNSYVLDLARSVPQEQHAVAYQSINIYTYIYIYIYNLLGLHMAPYGASGVEQSEVRRSEAIPKSDLYDFNDVE